MWHLFYVASFEHVVCPLFVCCLLSLLNSLSCVFISSPSAWNHSDSLIPITTVYLSRTYVVYRFRSLTSMFYDHDASGDVIFICSVRCLLFQNSSSYSSSVIQLIP
ncbi:hypothetical protein BJ165DRAFT_1503027 [Panaeolus papilionaceus]|nr:hypothetical protein BJ165DRAFT_1503027 [Panaeolus papilionaceus]